MAAFLADTNVLLRIVDPGSPEHEVAISYVAELQRKGEAIYHVAQNLYEFWAVATRPIASNGLGWDSERTKQEIEELQERFSVLPESDLILGKWLELDANFRIQGKRCHDARLAAVILINKLDHLLTFNDTDFTSLPVSVIRPDQLI
jgi:predicted nucleic acid-binding protein